MNSFEPTKKTEIANIPIDTFKENSVAIIVKSQGKKYAVAADIGNITQGMPDEDLDSTLRAVRGMCLNLLRTIAVQLAGKSTDYPLPVLDVEEDDGPEIIMMLADEDIKKGDPVVVDVELGRARNATADEVERTDEKPDTIVE